MKDLITAIGTMCLNICWKIGVIFDYSVGDPVNSTSGTYEISNAVTASGFHTVISTDIPSTVYLENLKMLGLDTGADCIIRFDNHSEGVPFAMGEKMVLEKFRGVVEVKSNLVIYPTSFPGITPFAAMTPKIGYTVLARYPELRRSGISNV